MHRKRPFLSSAIRAATLLAPFLAPGLTRAQEKLPLTDLSAFRSPAANWLIAGDVKAELTTKNLFRTAGGTGILVDQLGKTNQPADLLTVKSYGDLDLELDYMMAKEANSGVYLQGRYEIQLMDSWATIKPDISDNGSIYERWDDSKPEGHQGYEGHAPRQNASRATGVWQHLKISFQAPQFDAAGNKTSPARVLLVQVNGVTVQENVSLSGPTRGAIDQQEAALGPLRLQGDHGSVAFRHIVITDFGKPRPELTGLQYTVFPGKFDRGADLSKLKPSFTAPAPQISALVGGLPKAEFAVQFKGSFKVKEAGEYEFYMSGNNGGSYLFIDGKAVVFNDENDIAKLPLSVGDHPLELTYYKTDGYNKPSIGLTLKGPGIREYAVAEAAGAPSSDADDPILINADANTVTRSFIDLKGTIVTHAVSVGSPTKVNYTYDLDHGMIVQAWRGNFLDATPMWHDRGNGQSIPRGAVQRFGAPVPAIEKLASAQSAWSSDTTGTSFRPKGYSLDKDGIPTFRYLAYGTAIEDITTVIEEGRGFRREMTVKDPVPGLYIRLADAASIEELSKGFYLVDDKSYYLKLETTGGATPLIRDHEGRKELIVPISSKLSYSILF